MAKKGLGKGLNLLFDDNLSEESTKPEQKPAEKQDDNPTGVTYMSIVKIEPNKKQPRKTFDKEKIEILAESIKENGLIQPIIITEGENGMYKIVAGERRWRACKKAGLKEIPVLIRDYSDEQAAEVALVENLQREDLNPIEEALGYNLLMTEFSMTQETVSQKVGKSRSAVANSLRLLTLPDDIKNLLITGEMTGGHARAILSVEGEELRAAMAKRITDDGLNVRQAEALARQLSRKATVRTKPPVKSAAQAAAYEEMERKLSSSFGTKVKISSNGKKGKIEIEYFGNDDLDRIINMFNI